MVTCYPSQADQFLTSLLEAEKSNATDVDASNSHEKTLYFIKQFQVIKRPWCMFLSILVSTLSFCIAPNGKCFHGLIKELHN